VSGLFGVGFPGPIPIFPTKTHWVCGSMGAPGAVGLSWAAAQVYPVVPAIAAYEKLCP
jgi:hypothetical protein